MDKMFISFRAANYFCRHVSMNQNCIMLSNISFFRRSYLKYTNEKNDNPPAIISSCNEKVVKSYSTNIKEISSPNIGNLVYTGSLTNLVRIVKYFSLATSLSGLSMQPFLLQKISDTTNIFTIVSVGMFCGFFIFATPLLLNLVTKRYIIRLYSNKDTNTFTAITYRFFPLEKQIHFTPNDVKVPDIPGLFTSFIIRNKPLFIEPALFQDKESYIRLMKYDKPLDLSYDVELFQRNKKTEQIDHK